MDNNKKHFFRINYFNQKSHQIKAFGGSFIYKIIFK
jgi:hypothetical protein